MKASPEAGLLRVAGLGVMYGRLVALHDVTFALAPGAMLAVTGPSGAGKSSLLWALAGATPATGLTQLDGVPLRTRANAATRGVALVPQGNGLTTFLTAAENVLIPLLALGISPTEARRRATSALAAVGLEDSATHLIEELSGGQQQRVAIARGLAQEPAVLLIDEPTSDLDAANRQQVIAAMRQRAEAGAIVVMATHDPEAAGQLDAELGLDDGGMTWNRR